MKTENFDIPIVLFFFKRVEKTVQIVDQISKVKPKRLYLISDGPRNDEEAKLVHNCRKEVEAHVTWQCEIIRNYAETNKGVYDRIARGALWVFTKEDTAIFLEDDNLPELTFFPFCEEMLKMYKDDTRVLWICGTNYLKQYEPIDGSSYVFTKHMLPCGWASWNHKFTRFYDGELNLLKEKDINQKVKYSYNDLRLFEQDKRCWDSEIRRKSKGLEPISWDHQMSFSIRANGLLGIVPKYNQIRNIGVDQFSTHGGTSLSFVMTKRFCELETKQLPFPLVHPKVALCDPDFEKKTGDIILLPFKNRLQIKISSLLKRLLKLDPDFSFSSKFKSLISRPLKRI